VPTSPEQPSLKSFASGPLCPGYAPLPKSDVLLTRVNLRQFFSAKLLFETFAIKIQRIILFNMCNLFTSVYINARY